MSEDIFIDDEVRTDYYEYKFWSKRPTKFLGVLVPRNTSERQQIIIAKEGYYLVSNSIHRFIIIPKSSNPIPAELEMNNLLGLYIPHNKLQNKYPYTIYE